MKSVMKNLKRSLNDGIQKARNIQSQKIIEDL